MFLVVHKFVLFYPYINISLYYFILVFSLFYNYLNLKLKKRVNIKFERNCSAHYIYLKRMRETCITFI